jgi:hypothetical protein
MIEVAPGELLDKISILEIKRSRMGHPAKLANVKRELAVLREVARRAIVSAPRLQSLRRQLRAVNEALWVIEDEIRLCERRREFGARFVELARSVYRENDRRAALKRQINDLLRSRLVEEKSYTEYTKRSA